VGFAIVKGDGWRTALHEWNTPAGRSVFVTLAIEASAVALPPVSGGRDAFASIPPLRHDGDWPSRGAPSAPAPFLCELF
jgi:hypothetical protein